MLRRPAEFLPRRRAVIALFSLACLLVPAAAQVSHAGFEEAKAKFEKEFFNEDVVNRIALKNQATIGLASNAELLSDPRLPEYLYTVIDRATNWYEVGLVFELWTRLSGAARERLGRDLLDPKAKLSPRVRAAIAYMLADYGRTAGGLPGEDEQIVLRALGDADPIVRRYAALATQALPKTSTLDALLEQWAKEKDEGVISYILDSLRALSGKRELARDVAEWRSWREGNPTPDLSRGFVAPNPTRGSYAGLELEFTPAASGAGQAIWVFPPYGLTNAIYQPGLSVLESSGRITYVNMPVIAPDQEVPRDAEGNELYPVDQLAEAIEVLRAEQKEEKLILFGALDTSFYLVRYAALHPDRVRALILVQGWFDNEAYVASLEQLKAAGIEEEKLYTMAALKDPSTKGFGDSQLFSVKTGRLAATLSDPASVHGCFLWERFFDIRSQRSLVLPPIALSKEDKIPVSVLVIHGKKDDQNSVRFSALDGKRYFKPRARVEEIDQAGTLVWEDAPGELRALVESFIAKLE